MNLSGKGEYALAAIFDLAAHHNGEPIKIAQVAKRQKIPQKFLELILAALKQGGFVESRRGAEGGYLLARVPELITVGEVLRFIESSREAGTRGGHRHVESPFTGLWRQVDDAVSRILDHTTFAQLARDWTDRQNRYVHDWTI
jgi:Rrf2 family transcriptional regulator, cysteine metabolism repressor